jgi:hypothetical protein
MKVDVRYFGYWLLVIGFQSFTDSDAAYFSLAAKSGCILCGSMVTSNVNLELDV